MALGKRRRQNRDSGIPKLQITSMMDMFTIILIFLLSSYSNKPQVIQLEKDLRLPESAAQGDYQDNIKLVLSQSNLRLEDKIVATLRNGEIIGLDPEKLKESGLYRQLTSHREILDKSKPDTEAPEHIIFLCDKRVPFKTINQVIKTAAVAGYPNFQFAVLNK
ncbi:MAG: biopolymer transporter ExbD [bacterium]